MRDSGPEKVQEQSAKNAKSAKKAPANHSESFAFFAFFADHGSGFSRVPSPESRVPTPHSQRGFTLLEVIIAFALLALALTLLLGTLSGSTREVRWSADAGRAALHAQSLLDQTGVGEVLQPGARDGDFEDGRYRWTMRIEPYADPLQRAATIDPFAPRLLRLALTVEWGDGGPRQQLQVRTLRLAQPEVGQ